MVEIWEEIELSESYLVCCMFEEAATIASSVLKRVCDNKSTDVGEDDQLYEIIESAGMVLVQSLKELGRTLEILNELRQLFGSITAIPIQVLVTGACFEMSEGSTCAKQFLEEFLGKWRWRYVDEQYYVPASREPNVVYMGGRDRSFTLEMDDYLEVVDVYVVTLLGSLLNDMEHAFSWVEKAELPEEKRKELLTKLHSLHDRKAKSSQGTLSNSQGDDHEAQCSSKEVILPEGHLKGLKPQYQTNGEEARRKTVPNLSKVMDSCFWCYRSITLKLGNTPVVITNRKILWGCLIFLVCYIFQRKRATLKRIASRKVLIMKEALNSLWQLAFSYQVNPLAALQPLPPGNRS